MTSGQQTELQKHQENFWPALIAIIFGAFMAILSNTLVNVALPSLMNDFNTDLTTVQWVLTGFMLASGSIIPVTGYLGDRFSNKRVYLLSLAGFTLFSALCALSLSISTLIIFRVLQGLFGGMVMPLSMAIVYQIVPLEKRGLALGVWGIAAMAAPAIGPTLSGWIIQHASWRWLFLVNVPVGIIALFVGIRLLPYYRLNKPQTLDMFGLITAVFSSFCFLLAFSEGQTWGWESIPIVGLLFFAVISLLLFIWRELSIDDPLLDLRIFKKFRFTISVLTSSLITVGLFSGMFLTPVFLQNIQQAQPIDVGLILLPAALIMALFMPVSGFLFDRIGARFLVPIGIFFLVYGTYHMSKLTIDTPHSYITFWMAVRNIGISLSMMPATTAGMNAVPVALAGRASSINNWIRQVLASFSIAIFTALLNHRQAYHASVLSDQVQPFSLPVQEWLSAAGQMAGRIGQGVTEKTAALLQLFMRTQMESFTLGFNDVYFVSLWVIAIALPLGFWLGGRAKKKTS
jgi:EmrB/QacA subfamily drug resistance transporter